MPSSKNLFKIIKSGLSWGSVFNSIRHPSIAALRVISGNYELVLRACS